MPSRRSAFRLFLLSLLLVTLGVHAAIPTSGLVGSLKGEFSVDPSGAATYDIPITLPPNVGGVQPKLSFHYNSNSGNGLMGMGWQLAGLSEITRCPTTLERDGYIDGVDFDSNDQFCLDGQRLVSIGSGQYRTEIDNFSHITGTASAGFTVYAPDGTTLYYGISSSSQILAQGKSHVMVWALERVEDMAGNHYRVEYQNDGSSLGEYYLTAIYMGNGSLDLSSVEFEYEDRLDVISGYMQGSRYLTSQRLVGVETYVGATLVKRLWATYEDPILPFNISYISELGECDSIGTCGESITFEKGNVVTSTSIFTSSIGITLPANTWFGHSNSTQRAYLGDFNGDGRQDVFNADDWGNGFLYTSTGSGFTAMPIISLGSNRWFGHSNSTQRLHVADFNGDGRSDLFNVDDGGNGYLYLSTGTGFSLPSSSVSAGASRWFGHSNGTQRLRVADFNGDGRADLFNADDGGNGYLYLSTGTGFNVQSSSVRAGSSRWFGHSNGTQRLDVADFNGDGLADLFNADDGGNGFLYLSTGNGFSSNPKIISLGGNKWFGHSNGTQRLEVADFNLNSSINPLQPVNKVELAQEVEDFSVWSR